jgi:hypothetical protein
MAHTMKKITEFVTQNGVSFHDPDTDHPLNLQLYLELEPGRWELWADEHPRRAIVLKAKFQEPRSLEDSGSFFMGGKL